MTGQLCCRGGTLALLALLATILEPIEISSFPVSRPAPRGFVPLTGTSRRSDHHRCIRRVGPSLRPCFESTSRLFLNIDSNDPFQVLGLDEPTADVKAIKRAYKRQCLKFHPDVATTKDSTPEEKKEASDRFAKINWAYETLSGKRQDDNTYGTGKAGNTSHGSGSSQEWKPPHRRKGSYSTSTEAPSWEDFIPNYDDQYDTGGDSFEKIFSDMFAGAAAGGVGSTILRDFVEFLESNFDGYAASDDSDLRILLASGSIQDIGNEMDDTELVITQLKSKLNSITDEILSVEAEMRLPSRFIEKIQLEESLAELQARKDVVDGYAKKAQKRLLKIQSRYKELIVSGQDDKYATGASRVDTTRGATNTDKTSSTSDFYNSPSPRTSSQRNKGEAEGSAWKTEGFGSSASGRRRGSTRRSRAHRAASERQSEPERPSATESRPDVGRQPSAGGRPKSPACSAAPQNRASRGTNQASVVPPHRRQSSFQSQQEEKRRLRDLIVDEEFEKLKKDLGL